MQATPLRLQQAIRSAFRASKPIKPFQVTSQHSPASRTIIPTCSEAWRVNFRSTRPYSDRKSASLDSQVRDAQKRIDEAIESRAETVRPEATNLKKDETIIHTNPEASSIVHNTRGPGEAAAKDAVTRSSSTEKLPSEASSAQSHLRHRFSHFMDNFQSHVFVASRRLNDLTGYTGIEALKRDIEEQENLVKNARIQVKESRRQYSEAIENRSTTQREVNDLLQRKHAWGPNDLERFTSLYRSDHANEQAEQKAHEQLSQAESQYEEASTNLAKSILARYHEEQIWSDKIRQMSTWGTWGLMGLNVLLFIVFQIMIEPWRRKRLVRGFEEKVQEALKERGQDGNLEPPSEHADKLVHDAVGIVAVAGEKAAEAVAESLTGASDISAGQTKVPSRDVIEQTAEHATTGEILQEGTTAETVAAIAGTVEEGGVPDVLPLPSNENLSPSLSEKISNEFANYEDQFLQLFNDKAMVLVSQRDLTTRSLESAITGAAFMATFLWAIRRSR